MEGVVQYECLLPYQFEQRMEQAPVAFLPVGSLEWHGEHLALGNDAVKMHALCCEAAKIGGGVVFPPLFYGIPFMVEYGKAYRHKANLPVSADFLSNVLTTTLDGLERVGFKAAILATGHTCKQQSALTRRIAGEYTGTMRVYGTDDMEWADDLEFTSDHAARWETSLLWYLRPELVDLDRLPQDTEAPLEGVYGDDPRTGASRELGERAARAIARDLAKKGRELLGR